MMIYLKKGRLPWSDLLKENVKTSFHLTLKSKKLYHSEIIDASKALCQPKCKSHQALYADRCIQEAAYED